MVRVHLCLIVNDHCQVCNHWTGSARISSSGIDAILYLHHVRYSTPFAIHRAYHFWPIARTPDLSHQITDHSRVVHRPQTLQLRQSISSYD